MRPYLRFIPLGLFFLFALLMASGLLTRHVPSSPMLGRAFPPFALQRADNPSEMLLSREWQGKPILLNVFATWCEPCRDEHPLLAQLAAATPVPLVGMAWRDTRENVLAYLQHMGNPYSAVGMDSIGQMTVPLGLSGVPETFLVDAHGIVRWKYNGPLTADVVQKELMPLLKEYGAAQ